MTVIEKEALLPSNQERGTKRKEEVPRHRRGGEREVEEMLLLLFLGLFLLCVGIKVFSFYLCLLWCASIRGAPTAPAQGKLPRGLSVQDIQRLPGAGDGSAVAGTECAVCLEDIEAGQPARVLPSCSHAFHLACADTWLATTPACPICRATLAVPSPLPPPPLPQPAS